MPVEPERAAVNRFNRLFTKNAGLCTVVSRRIGADACPVPEGYVEVLAASAAKHRNYAPVNGGRNYNGPKVAKFLVG